MRYAYFMFQRKVKPFLRNLIYEIMVRLSYTLKLHPEKSFSVSSPPTEEGGVKGAYATSSNGLPSPRRLDRGGRGGGGRGPVGAGYAIGMTPGWQGLHEKWVHAKMRQETAIIDGDDMRLDGGRGGRIGGYIAWNRRRLWRRWRRQRQKVTPTKTVNNTPATADRAAIAPVLRKMNTYDEPPTRLSAVGLVKKNVVGVARADCAAVPLVVVGVSEDVIADELDAGNVDEDAGNVDEDDDNVDEDADKVDEDADKVDEDADNVDEDARDVDEDVRDVDEDARDVDEDVRDVDEDVRDVDEDVRDVDEDAMEEKLEVVEIDSEDVDVCFSAVVEETVAETSAVDMSVLVSLSEAEEVVPAVLPEGPQYTHTDMVAPTVVSPPMLGIGGMSEIPWEVLIEELGTAGAAFEIGTSEVNFEEQIGFKAKATEQNGDDGGGVSNADVVAIVLPVTKGMSPAADAVFGRQHVMHCLGKRDAMYIREMTLDVRTSLSPFKGRFNVPATVMGRAIMAGWFAVRDWWSQGNNDHYWRTDRAAEKKPWLHANHDMRIEGKEMTGPRSCCVASTDDYAEDPGTLNLDDVHMA
ncbi:hypothetical protein FISHEDRAFT_55679 [Fistulina hepatica ATCC 64428]|uniref:Uncharacterized protein n=1 Tax=Fistulina hepatica ATCC 64428 TaxID=1128425 RepID=A0A0D7AN20_9AGAR|nr:hypothetical protein FISHEDRAFT_55679 [Fistulina hepatica ATCC 64428]